ncbi:MAG: RNA-binding protein [Ruminococcus sp.]|nr:RNA-binding protein [Ruminococcus sp.]
MKNSLSFLGTLSPEDKLLAGRVIEMAETAAEKYISKFTFFLDERQKALCKKVLASVCVEDHLFFGGYDNAERTVLGISAPYSPLSEEVFPFKALTFSFRESDKLSHRDFLGCLMGLGIQRDTVGDIIVSDGRAVVFVYDTVAPLAEGIEKVGRVGVKVREGFDLSVIPQKSFLPIEGTVASLRLDSVAALAFHISREKAAALIRSGGIELNYAVQYSADRKVEQGDVFSSRGRGKFRVEEIGSLTRKDRIHIKINKYA